MTRARNSANLASHGNLFVDITNDRTGIGSVVPGQSLHVAGTAGFHADTTFTGDLYNATWDRSDNSLKFVDNAKIKVGTGGDLEIFHTGAGSYIHDTGQGNLHICSNQLQIINGANTEIQATFQENGAVSLYHDNVKKFETTAYGTNTTGTAVNDGLVVAGVATVTTMNVTGVLTYDDVTSVDSVGIVTARQGLRAPGGTTLLGATSSGFTPHNTNWATNSALRLLGNFGGGLTFNDNNNNGYSMYINTSGNNFFIKNGAVGGSLKTSIKCVKDGAVELYHNDNLRVQTDTSSTIFRGGSGIRVYGDDGSNQNGQISIHPTGSAVYSNLLFYNAAGNAYASIIGHAGQTLFFTGGTNGPLRFRVNGSGHHSFQEGNTEKVRITASGVVNIAPNNLSQTTYKFQVETGTNKFISFTNAAHDDLGNEGSAIVFSRQSDGSKQLSGIFGHNNTSLGIAARDSLTFHAGGTSDYEATPERMRVTSDGQVIVNGTTNLGHPNMDDIVVGDASGNRGITIASGSGTNFGSVAFGDSTDGSGADRYEGLIEYYHGDDSLSFYTAHVNKLKITSEGYIGLAVANPRSKLHLPVNEDVRIGGQYGGTAQVQNEVSYSSGYTGVHWMFESNQSVSWCFDGVMIINGDGSSSYGSEVVKITIVYSREHGALNSGDTHRNGSSSYNIETLGHDQVGLNPSAGSLSVTEQTDPDGAGSTRSLFKLSWSASGQSVGVDSRLLGNIHWSAAASSGNVEIQDKDGNVKWNSNP